MRRVSQFNLTNPLIITALALTASGLFSGCQIERLFADDVGAGIARLNVRTAGVLTALIEADESCGFSSDQVKVNVDGTPGELGAARFVVTECRLEFSELTEISRDCNDVAIFVQGVAVVSATRTVSGTLTGDPANPVIPASADAVEIAVDADLVEFRVVHESNPAVLTVHGGELSFAALPRLAVGSKAPGVCSVATPNVALEDLVLARATVDLFDGESRTIPVDVVTSRLFAQVGVGPADENHIEGSILVWDKNVILKDNELDSTYEAGDFVAGYTDPTCLDAERAEAIDAGADPASLDRIASPLSFECKGLDAIIADGAARLLVQDIGMISQLAEADASCGFNTVTPTVDGVPGGQGRATWTIAGCAIELPADTLLSTGCDGSETRASGRVVVSGVKTIEGWLTGSALNPVVPMNDTPARIAISAATLDGFTVGSAKGALTLESGTLSGVVEPRTALAVDTQACSVTTRHVRVTDLVFEGPGQAGVASPQGQFEIQLGGANIAATNGQVGSAENHIDGSITVGAETYQLSGLPSGNVLDSGYDAASFEASFACDEALVQPLSYECAFDETLAGGFARLSVNALAQMASALEADDACGFSSQGVIDAAVVTGELGRDGGSATFTATDCALDFTAPLTLGADCNGDAVTLSGRALVSGTKTLTGIVSGDPLEPVVPTDWEPATLSVSVAFDDMRITSTAMPQGLHVVTGALSGTLNPRTALDTVTGACSMATPVAGIELTWSPGAELKLIAGETEVAGFVDGAAVTATNGKRAAAENAISGALTLGGREYDVGGALNPGYDEAAFTDAFSCAPNMRVPLSAAECSFKQTLADGAARLIIQSVGEVARLANSEGGCAFSGLGVLTSPTSVIGDPGEQGSLTFEIEECVLGPGAFEDGPDLVGEDCDAVESYHQGQFTVSAQRHVTGEREELNILFITADSIIPNSRDAVSVTLHEVLFDNFRPFHLNQDGTSADPGVLTLHTGALSGTVLPVLGENAATPGAFDVPTPVSALNDVSLSAAEVTLEAQGKTFKFTIDATDIDAFNGSFGGRQNEIAGTVTIEGEVVTLNGGLDPNFSQADFDSGYSCNEDLVDIIRP